MNNTPMISVIIPVYNVEDFLKECVDSVLKQTFTDYEIILVDDASTDRSGKTADSIAENQTKIRVLHLAENGGQGNARNQGLKAARGEYIAFIDSDDLILPDYLDRLFHTAAATHADIVSMGYTEYILSNDDKKYHAGRAINTVQSSIKMTNNLSLRMKSMLNYKLIAQAGGKLIKHELLVNQQITFENMTGEDILYHFLLLCHAPTYVLIPDVSYYYRQTQTSTTRGHSPEKCHKALQAIATALSCIDTYYFSVEILRKIPNTKNSVKRFLSRLSVGSYYYQLSAA